jgi:hypothetical protein
MLYLPKATQGVAKKKSWALSPPLLSIRSNHFQILNQFITIIIDPLDSPESSLAWTPQKELRQGKSGRMKYGNDSQEFRDKHYILE